MIVLLNSPEPQRLQWSRGTVCFRTQLSAKENRLRIICGLVISCPRRQA